MKCHIMGIYTSGDVPQKGKYKRESLRKPLSSHVDYGTLFPDDILASNIDFLIERNGEFLETDSDDSVFGF